MSIRHEQYQSLKLTREFLLSLLDPKRAAKNRHEITTAASRCLRHFPPLEDTGQPIFSKDDIRLPPA